VTGKSSVESTTFCAQQSHLAERALQKIFLQSKLPDLGVQFLGVNGGLIGLAVRTNNIRWVLQ
jgi:hypothetical protein